MEHVDLIGIGAVVLVAGLVARAGRRIGLPTIPCYLVVGILLGPGTPGPVFVEHPGDLSLLAALGLVLLLFHLGLEFPLEQVISSGRRLFLAAGFYIGLNISAGLALGLALGWGAAEALVIAGAMGISSSAIATKETHHPIVESLEPGEHWRYCYVDNTLVRPSLGQRG